MPTRATLPASRAVAVQERGTTQEVTSSPNEEGTDEHPFLPAPSINLDEAELDRVEQERLREVADLCDFQRSAIADLDVELSELDKQIAQAEAEVLENSNRLHGLRGLMQMRGNRAAAAAALAGKNPNAENDGNPSSGTAEGSTREATVLDPSIFSVGPRQKTRDFRGQRHQPRVAGGRQEKGKGAKGGGELLLGKREGSKNSSLRDAGAGESGAEDACDPLPIIGTVYSEFSKRFEAPRQSFQGPAGRAVVVLPRVGDADCSSALEGVVPGAHICILYHFDRNADFWREMVRPPRALGGWRVGVFATRSPHRPTPIGLSLAEVESVKSGDDIRIHVKGVDILDETPVVGWRLYDKETECHFNLRSGWLDDKDKLQPLYYDEVSGKGTDGSALEAAAEECRVSMADGVRDKLSFLNAKTTIDVFAMLDRALGRIVRDAEGHPRALDGRSEVRPFPSLHDGSSGDWKGESGPLTSMYPVGAWRVWFRWGENESVIQVIEVSSGIRKEVMSAEGDVDREIREHREFSDRFGQLLL